ncbi:unnamed protein product, partial [Mesorhabditis spiculigera]
MLKPIILLIFITIASSYTITQSDVLWINSLKSTAQAYYNRAWWRRQNVEAARRVAVTTVMPALYTKFLDRSAAKPSHTRPIPSRGYNQYLTSGPEWTPEPLVVTASCAVSPSNSFAG